MPKIFVTSDLHGQLPEVPDCDVLLIVGDICPDFIMTRMTATRIIEDNGHQRQKTWLDTVFRDWLIELSNRDILVVATWGNHDFVGEKDFLVRELDLPWTLLVDNGLKIDFPDRDKPLFIWGTPWVPNLPSWAFFANPRALELRAKTIPDGVDVLMTHGPPQGYGDIVGPKFGGPLRVGDPHLTAELDRIGAQTVLCGHIHEDAGSHVFNERILVRNVSYLDENYEPQQPPVELVEFLTY
jgi:Icc-related predicted phosphoesterase